MPLSLKVKTSQVKAIFLSILVGQVLLGALDYRHIILILHSLSLQRIFRAVLQRHRILHHRILKEMGILKEISLLEMKQSMIRYLRAIRELLMILPAL